MTKNLAKLMAAMRKDVPSGMVGCCAYDDAATPADLWWACRITLDLIEEGEEEADYWTTREVQKLRRLVEKYKRLCGSIPTD